MSERQTGREVGGEIRQTGKQGDGLGDGDKLETRRNGQVGRTERQKGRERQTQ